MEEGQLHGTIALRRTGGSLSLVLGLKGGQGFLCHRQHFFGHSGHSGHMNTKTMGRTARFQFAKEDNLLASFFHCHVEVAYAGVQVFKVVQLVVVGRKQRFGPVAVFVDIFHDGAGN